MFFSSRMYRSKAYVSHQMGIYQKGLIAAPRNGEWMSFPDLFVFDPMNDLKLEIVCPTDSQHGLLTTTDFWTDFGKQKPRLIYGLKRNAWLISRQLKCSTCVSLYLSHDKTILSQLPDSEITEFLLFKRSGIFRDLFNLIIGMITKGQTFKKTAEALEEMKKTEICQLYYGDTCNLPRQIVQKLNTQTFKCFENKMIRDLFLYFFQNIQDTLMQEFRSIKSNEFSVDHTYKTW